MNAIFQKAFSEIEQLSPADQLKLAEEMEARARRLRLEAEIERGEQSGGEIPVEEVFDRIKRRYGA
jgi:hypothetical protein